MERRRIGRDGPEASAVALGTMALSGVYGAVDEDAALAVIDRALALGIDHLDTAEGYGAGHNERLVGRALAGRRAGVLLSTKFNGRARPGAEGRPWGDHVRMAIEGSLERLGVDRVDLWYLHRVPARRPIEETWEPMARIVQEGLARYIGLSEAGPDTIRRAHAVYPVTALQSEWSLLSREVEARVIPAVRELGIGFVAYSPLARGLLGGRIREAGDVGGRDFRRSVPRFEDGHLDANLAVVDRLAALAAARGVPLPRLAVAWVLAQGGDVVPLVGASRPDQLDDTATAADLVLGAGDLAALEAAAPPGSASGDRYPEAFMAGLDE